MTTARRATRYVHEPYIAEGGTMRRLFG